VGDLAGRFRREALDTYSEMFPDIARKSIDVGEITAALCIAAGELLRQYGDEQYRDMALRLLVNHLVVSSRPEDHDANQAETAPDQISGDKKPEPIQS
jgi:hypothetical protein